MSSPRLVDVRALMAELDTFADARDWRRHHSPKNLAMALTGEVGELVELFQWQSEADSYDTARRESSARAVRDEMADVLIYLVRMASVLDVDLDEVVRSKLLTNAQKYPAPEAS